MFLLNRRKTVWDATVVSAMVLFLKCTECSSLANVVEFKKTFIHISDFVNVKVTLQISILTNRELLG